MKYIVKFLNLFSSVVLVESNSQVYFIEVYKLWNSSCFHLKYIEIAKWNDSFRRISRLLLHNWELCWSDLKDKQFIVRVIFSSVWSYHSFCQIPKFKFSSSDHVSSQVKHRVKTFYINSIVCKGYSVYPYLWTINSVSCKCTLIKDLVSDQCKSTKFLEQPISEEGYLRVV